MAKDYLFPGGVLSLPREAAKRLIDGGSPDAALLYLALLADAAQALPWPPDRLQSAYQALVELNLADPAVPAVPPKAVKLEPEGPPEYGSGDIALALKEEKAFPFLVEEVQRRLGKLLSHADLQTLMILYDYLALPAEVILLLTGWCIRGAEEKYGPGRKPSLSQIKKEAFHWHRQGIDTLEGAEAHLRKMTAREEAAARLMPLVGILGRAPVEAERRYLEAWSEMGFDDDAIRMAYEKTVLKKQSMNWAYMNSILRSWQQKGLRTKAEILEKEHGGRRDRPTAPVSPVGGPGGQGRMQQDMDRLDRLLEQGRKKGD